MSQGAWPRHDAPELDLQRDLTCLAIDVVRFTYLQGPGGPGWAIRVHIAVQCKGQPDRQQWLAMPPELVWISWATCCSSQPAGSFTNLSILPGWVSASIGAIGLTTAACAIMAKWWQSHWSCLPYRTAVGVACCALRPRKPDLSQAGRPE